jgi:hypothetical protein
MTIKFIRVGMSVVGQILRASTVERPSRVKMAMVAQGTWKHLEAPSWQDRI